MTNPTAAAFTPGQIVRYAVPQAGEEGLTFVVIECHEDRTLIRSLDFTEYRIAPIELVAPYDLAPVDPPRPPLKLEGPWIGSANAQTDGTRRKQSKRGKVSA